MFDFEMMEYCKKALRVYVAKYFQENPDKADVRVYSDSSAIEMMMVNDDLQKESDFPGKISAVNSEKEGSHFMVKRL
ncbi:hypothetical protein WDW89_16430 [Deltaproteobacteria bacterium TL4]